MQFGPDLPMPPGENWHRPYALAARDATNTLIDAYRIVTRHVFAHRIGQPEEWDVQPLAEPSADEPQRPSVHVWEPLGGIRIKRTFGQVAVQAIQDILDGRHRVQIERLLLLDAERFAMDGDVNHAVLNTAVALEVFIQRILGTSYPARFYSSWDTELVKKYGHSLYEAEFFDSNFKKTSAFEILEFIHATRNAIVHEGEPVFRIRHLGRWKSRFLENHQQWDGKRVPQQETLILIDAAKEIRDGWKSCFPRDQLHSKMVIEATAQSSCDL